ncbi:hypothetical protein AB205_0177310 [Aquarana catesbeiana]|uniref:Uncharacterized protein n=1 Tax=Aquarana catesbeiana TaxID=8400 RepID=A0A2G9RJI6_AQUCT|nr:hypothetical protein AB205_0177310 [Aquarana catesbeiana]
MDRTDFLCCVECQTRLTMASMQNCSWNSHNVTFPATDIFLGAVAAYVINQHYNEISFTRLAVLYSSGSSVLPQWMVLCLLLLD